MESSSIGYLIGIIFCVIGSAFFSASETAYTTLNRIRLKNAAEGGDSRAKLVLKVSENYDTLLSTILVGNNIVNITSASLATIVFTKWLGNAGVSASTAVITVVVLIFGEISPKSLAKENPERFARFAAPIFRVFITILTPINFLFVQWKKLLSRIFKNKADNVMTQEELKIIVDEAQNEGGIDEDNGELIRSAIDFDEEEARDILTPRVDIIAVDHDTEFEKIAEVFANNSFSRLPVYKNSIDSILGMIHEKDYFTALYRGVRDIDSIVSEVLYINGSMKISDLLRQLQKSKTHMAIVVDEFGGTEGIVTMEDIIEELVGDIWDEHDIEIHYFTKLDENTYSVDGGADLEELFELFDVNASEDDFESVTVNGWVMEQLGKIPAAGDSFDFEGLHVVVTEATPHNAERITVTRRIPQDDKE